MKCLLARQEVYLLGNVVLLTAIAVLIIPLDQVSMRRVSNGTVL
jgi:hypothetical protein